MTKNLKLLLSFCLVICLIGINQNLKACHAGGLELSTWSTTLVGDDINVVGDIVSPTSNCGTCDYDIGIVIVESGCDPADGFVGTNDLDGVWNPVCANDKPTNTIAADILVDGCPGKTYDFYITTTLDVGAGAGFWFGQPDADFGDNLFLTSATTPGDTPYSISIDYTGDFLDADDNPDHACTAGSNVITTDQTEGAGFAYLDPGGDGVYQVECGTVPDFCYASDSFCSAQVWTTTELTVERTDANGSSGPVTILARDETINGCMTDLGAVALNAPVDNLTGPATFTFTYNEATCAGAGFVREFIIVLEPKLSDAGDVAIAVDNGPLGLNDNILCEDDNLDLEFSGYDIEGCGNDGLNYGWSTTAGFVTPSNSVVLATAAPHDSGAPILVNIVNDGSFPTCQDVFFKPHLSTVNGPGGTPGDACYDEGAEIAVVFLDPIQFTLNSPACESIDVTGIVGGLPCYDPTTPYTVEVLDAATGAALSPVKVITGGAISFIGDVTDPNFGADADDNGVTGGVDVLSASDFPNAGCGGPVPGGTVQVRVTDDQGCLVADGMVCVEVCCITSSGVADGPGAELCEGEDLVSVAGAGISIAAQNGPTATLEGSVYASGFVLVDLASNAVVAWEAGIGPANFAPPVGCYQVYSYNYNLFTGEPGADLVGQDITAIQAGLFTNPQPVSGAPGGDGANCASLSDPGPEIFVYPELAITTTTSDYNGYGVSCNFNSAICTNPATPYSCINDGFIEMTITGGTGDTAADCGFGTVDYIITVTDGFGVQVFNGLGGAGGTVVLADDGGFGLLAGIYTIEVLDQFVGCSVSTIVNITEPPLVTCSSIGQDVSCADGQGADSDGTIYFEIEGGVPDPTFGDYNIFLDGAFLGFGGPGTLLIGDTFTPGTYVVAALDANGCGCEEEIIIEQPEPIVVECSGNALEGSNGNFSPFWYNTHQISVTGGTAPYSVEMDREGYVRWDIAQADGVNEAELTINYSDSAEWCVSIIDAKGCTVDATAFDCCNDDGTGDGEPSIPGSNGDILDIESADIMGESAVNAEDGAIDITIAGCTAGATYAWTGPNGFSESTEDIMGLEAGLYQVTVTCDGETTNGWYWVPLDRNGGRLKVGDSTPLGITAYPNPMVDNTTIEFSVENSGQASVQIFTIDGKFVNEIYNQQTETGNVYFVDLKANELNAGTYISVIVDAQGERAMNRIVVLK